MFTFSLSWGFSSSHRSYDASFAGTTDTKSYVLISQLPADVYSKHVDDVNTAHLTGFTFVVISIVHLAGGKIPEGMFLIGLFYDLQFSKS